MTNSAPLEVAERVEFPVAFERTNESGRMAGGMEQRDGAAAEVDLGAVLDKFAWPRGRDRVAGKVVVRRGKVAERLGRQPALPLRSLRRRVGERRGLEGVGATVSKLVRAADMIVMCVRQQADDGQAGDLSDRGRRRGR